MKIVYFSATNFGHRCLEAIKDLPDIEISGICTMPEEFSISYSEKPVKNCNFFDFVKYSEEHKIPCITFEKSSDERYVEFIKKCEPDLILVIGWYYMVPKSIREIPTIATLGVHASLLPKYRGGAPLVWAMINGEKEAGVSLFEITKRVDEGDIYGQKSFPIENEDYIKDVLAKAETASIEILKETLPTIASGHCIPQKQDHSQATHVPQRSPEDGEIDWSKSPEEIENFIRAQSDPYPGAFTVVEGKRVVVKHVEDMQNLKQQTSK